MHNRPLSIVRRREDSAVHIRDLVDRCPVPRNQIAALSGLTNTYIRDLEQGRIVNVGREKLIALGVALNLSLKEIDRLMTVFDRRPLSLDDIPLFLQTAEQRRFSNAFLPVYDDMTLGLIFLSAERLTGRRVVVSSEPTVCLREPGHRLYAQRKLVQSHPIYGPLVDAIGSARHKTLVDQLGHQVVVQYICRHCLRSYLAEADDEVERRWRRRHVKNVIRFIETHDNWHFYLVDTCPTFIFVLKETPQAPDKLILTQQPRHRFQGRRADKLVGFTTENPVVVQNFKKELSAIAAVTIPEFQDRRSVVDHLYRLLSA